MKAKVAYASPPKGRSLTVACILPSRRGIAPTLAAGCMTEPHSGRPETTDRRNRSASSLGWATTAIVVREESRPTLGPRKMSRVFAMSPIRPRSSAAACLNSSGLPLGAFTSENKSAEKPGLRAVTSAAVLSGIMGFGRAVLENERRCARRSEARLGRGWRFSHTHTQPRSPLIR